MLQKRTREELQCVFHPKHVEELQKVVIEGRQLVGEFRVTQQNRWFAVNTEKFDGFSRLGQEQFIEKREDQVLQHLRVTQKSSLIMPVEGLYSFES